METRFPYNKIFKQAFEITKTHRWLWVFGFVVYFFQGLLPEILVVNIEKSYSPDFFDIIFSSPGFFIAAFFFSVIVTLASLYGGSIAQATILKGIEGALQKQKLSWKNFFDKGLGYALSLTWLGLAVLAFLLISFAVLILPVYYFEVREMTAQASILGVIASLIFIVFFSMSAAVWSFAAIFIVLTEQTLAKSVNLAVDLFRKKWLICFGLFGLSLLVILVPALTGAIFLAISETLTTLIFMILESFAVVMVMAIWLLAWEEFTKSTLLNGKESVGAEKSQPVPNI